MSVREVLSGWFTPEQLTLIEGRAKAGLVLFGHTVDPDVAERCCPIAQVYGVERARHLMEIDESGEGHGSLAREFDRACLDHLEPFWFYTHNGNEMAAISQYPVEQRAEVASRLVLEALVLGVEPATEDWGDYYERFDREYHQPE